MFKVFLNLVLLAPLSVFAQVSNQGLTETEKNCQVLLAGEQSVLLKNEIKKNKEALYGSELVKKFCPSLDQMKDDEAKTQAVAHIIAVHSFFQNWCRPNSNQQHDLTRKTPTERPGARTWFGGMYYLPVDANFRNKELKGTPCDVTELTPNAQTQCAVYLAAMHDDKSWTSQNFSVLARTNKWSKENNTGFRRQLKSLSPDCEIKPVKASANKDASGKATGKTSSFKATR